MCLFCWVDNVSDLKSELISHTGLNLVFKVIGIFFLCALSTKNTIIFATKPSANGRSLSSKPFKNLQHLLLYQRLDNYIGAATLGWLQILMSWKSCHFLKKNMELNNIYIHSLIIVHIYCFKGVSRQKPLNLKFFKGLENSLNFTKYQIPWILLNIKFLLPKISNSLKIHWIWLNYLFYIVLSLFFVNPDTEWQNGQSYSQFDYFFTSCNVNSSS